MKGESTTPTGAAILKACVDQFVEPAVFIPQKIGYGVGFKDFSVPNVLRVVLCEVPDEESTTPERSAGHYKIEANIDDMSPEAYEPLQATLMRLGASDVYFTSIVMKKSRPATCLSVLVPVNALDVVADAVLNHSTTIGLRILPFEKRTLPRELTRVQTSLGEVQIKIVSQPDGHRRWKSEFDDVRRLAEANQMDYLRAKQIIDRELDAHFQSSGS